MTKTNNEIDWLRDITKSYNAQAILWFYPELNNKLDELARPLCEAKQIGVIQPRFLLPGDKVIAGRVIYTREDCKNGPLKFVGSLCEKYFTNHYLYLNRAKSCDDSNNWSDEVYYQSMHCNLWITHEIQTFDYSPYEEDLCNVVCSFLKPEFHNNGWGEGGKVAYLGLTEEWDASQML